MNRQDPATYGAPHSENGSVGAGRSPARGPSPQLILEGVVASYIHEISERHTPAPAAGKRTLPAGGEQLA